MSTYSPPTIAVEVVLATLKDNQLVLGLKKFDFDSSALRGSQSPELTGMVCASLNGCGIVATLVEPLTPWAAKRDEGMQVTLPFLAMVRPDMLGDDSFEFQATWAVSTGFNERPPAGGLGPSTHRAMDLLKSLCCSSSVTAHMLPEKFTLAQFRSAIQVFSTVAVDSANFRRKILKQEILLPSDISKGRGRPAQTYTLKQPDSLTRFDRWVA